MPTDEPDTDEAARPKRYFTVAEANEALPDLVGKVSQIAERMKRARAMTESVKNEPEGPEKHAVVEEIDELRVEIEALIDEIQEEGVEVKGLWPALLDFPALMNGREVYLCWREGETTIEHWHPLHTGFAGRQKLDRSQIAAFEWEN
jgi:hypothetical protein